MSLLSDPFLCKRFPQPPRFFLRYNQTFDLPIPSWLAMVPPSITLPDTSEHLSVCFNATSQHRSGTPEPILSDTSELILTVSAPFYSKACSVNPSTFEICLSGTTEEVAPSHRKLFCCPVSPSLLHPLGIRIFMGVTGQPGTLL